MLRNICYVTHGIVSRRNSKIILVDKLWMFARKVDGLMREYVENFEVSGIRYRPELDECTLPSIKNMSPSYVFAQDQPSSST